MGNISDLEANISQMQQLLNAAQNDIQKKTFEEIISLIISSEVIFNRT